MPLLLLSKTPLEFFKPLGRNRTLPIFIPLAVVSGSILRSNEKLNSNPTHKRVYFWVLFLTLLKTIFGTTVRQVTLVQSIICALMKARMTYLLTQFPLTNVILSVLNKATSSPPNPLKLMLIRRSNILSTHFLRWKKYIACQSFFQKSYFWSCFWNWPAILWLGLCP